VLAKIGARAARLLVLQQRIEVAVAVVERVDAVYAQLEGPMGLRPEGELWSAVNDLSESYVAVIDADIGRGMDWVGWYIWENDCGRRGHDAGFDDECRAIRSVADLMWVIADCMDDDVDQSAAHQAWSSEGAANGA